MLALHVAHEIVPAAELLGALVPCAREFPLPSVDGVDVDLQVVAARKL